MTSKTQSEQSQANASAVGCMDLLGLPSNTEKSGFNAHDKTDGKEEWLTPPEIIKALGDFDLDPCSPTDETRPWPTAKLHYSCAEHKNVTALIFARTETQRPSSPIAS